MRIKILSLLIVGGFGLLLFACAASNTSNLTTNTQSTQFSTDGEKLTFLKKYVTLYSAIEATEYQIVYQDNSAGGVPGPSDWDIQMALKIAPEDVVLWTADMQKIAPELVDLAWGYQLLPDEPRWKFQAQPLVYTRANVIVAVFPQQGILFKRMWTQ